MDPVEAPTSGSDQGISYQRVAASYGPALDRLARAYEADPDKRLDLLQEIHLALWRSFEGYEARYSLRTWVYRVAHNVATSHVIRQRRHAGKLVDLENVEATSSEDQGELAADQRMVLERLLLLIRQLKPLDRQVMLSYLEGLDAASIAVITGLSPSNVATRTHRIKKVLVRRFHQGEHHE